jgi:hypothetical protein
VTELSVPLNTDRAVALQALPLVLLYSLPLLVTIRPATDPDVWWHLREGQ